MTPIFTALDLFFYTIALLIGIHCLYLMDNPGDEENR